MATKLSKTPTGYEYETPWSNQSTHYTIEPCVMDDGPRSKGHRAWNVTPDPLGKYPSRTYDRLYEVRDALGSLTG